MKERIVYCIEKEEYDWDSVKCGSAILLLWIVAMICRFNGSYEYTKIMTEISVYISLGLALTLIFWGMQKRKKLVKIKRRKRK